MLSEIIFERHNVLNDINNFTRHNLFIRHDHKSSDKDYATCLSHNLIRHKHTTEFLKDIYIHIQESDLNPLSKQVRNGYV